MQRRLVPSASSGSLIARGPGMGDHSTGLRSWSSRWRPVPLGSRAIATEGVVPTDRMCEEVRVTQPWVFILDGQKRIADAYAPWLETVADVAIAYGGEEALDAVDDGHPPDVVLLDRHMSGDEVLTRLRERELLPG